MAGVVGLFASIGEHLPIFKKDEKTGTYPKRGGPAGTSSEGFVNR